MEKKFEARGEGWTCGGQHYCIVVNGVCLVDDRQVVVKTQYAEVSCIGNWKDSHGRIMEYC